ncbi:MAG: protein-L-isoaspartate(D-aspartate) O-methyltransferase [Aggregatilineales bacterium]
MDETQYAQQRLHMVQQQLRGRGIRDERVLEAMKRVPRHLFVPEAERAAAYEDCALPIGNGQTISQPYIVALMTQQLRLRPTDRVLEIGTGSGYQTAILCAIAREVFSIERDRELAQSAARNLAQIGCRNVELYVGDGSQGLPDMAPFDAILVTAGAPEVPAPLLAQLSPEGGRLVIPVGRQRGQRLELHVRNGDRWSKRELAAVRFVPLIGRHGFSAPDQDDTASESHG